jgi:hypothetical protein
MPMIAIFGAEILAAEAAAAAAAEIAAAEAAAATAAEIAAAEAAAATAAEVAAQQAAQQATQAGIMEVGGATANAPLTAEATQAAAMNSGMPPAEFVPKGSLNPSTGQFINTTLPPEPIFQSGQGLPSAVTSPVTDGGITSIPQAAPPAPNTLPMGVDMPGAYTPPSNALYTPPASTYTAPPSALESGFDKALRFADKHPFPAMTLAYTGANMLGLMNPSGATFNDKPYDGPLSKYKLSPNFKASNVNPADYQYNPRRYATGGGIMNAGSYDIPVGYEEGGPVALPLPSRTMRSSDAFQVPGQPQDASQFAAADAYNDIIRSRVIDDTATGRLTDGNRGYYQATPDQLTGMAQGRGSFGPGFARDELGARSNAGEFAVPGYGDLGQFAGGRGGSGKGFEREMDYSDNDMSSLAFAKGGSLSSSIEQYQKMLEGRPQAAPARSADVGIYYDQDPDTRYQDALTAAQIRQAKVNQRAYVSPPAAKRPTPMGKLNMPTSAKSKGGGDVEAASGGIMQSSLGGYAAGGNPRLLKGPGDGMSDNIPATINGRQPARLADGEFVIPADVVSHLGNGSTEAGAKQLHAMMNKVRRARTGNSKQGKNIKPQKYMPK